MTNKQRLGMALVSILALSAAPALAQSAADREAQDRHDIEKLMWQYTRALDTESPDAYAAAFTPDGEFHSGGAAVKGHEALKKMVEDLRQNTAAAEAKGQKRPAMFHVTTTSYLEFLDKDHARIQAYWMTVFAGDAPGAAARIAAVGREVDQLVRMNGKWLIQSRDVAPKDEVPVH